MSHDNLQYSTFQFKCKNNYLLTISFCHFIFKLCFVVKLDIQCRVSSPRCSCGQKHGVMEKPSLYSWSCLVSVREQGELLIFNSCITSLLCLSTSSYTHYIIDLPPA